MGGSCVPSWLVAASHPSACSMLLFLAHHRRTCLSRCVYVAMPSSAAVSCALKVVRKRQIMVSMSRRLWCVPQMRWLPSASTVSDCSTSCTQTATAAAQQHSGKVALLPGTPQYWRMVLRWHPEGAPAHSAGLQDKTSRVIQFRCWLSVSWQYRCNKHPRCSARD